MGFGKREPKGPGFSNLKLAKILQNLSVIRRWHRRRFSNGRGDKPMKAEVVKHEAVQRRSFKSSPPQVGLWRLTAGEKRNEARCSEKAGYQRTIKSREQGGNVGIRAGGRSTMPWPRSRG